MKTLKYRLRNFEAVFEELCGSIKRQKSWLWVGVLVLTSSLAYYWDSKETKNNIPVDPDAQANASTYIPVGYVLVPIEVANYEALDSILGSFGVVDLFIPSDNGKQRARKVAERIKILRAPLNPSQFAVLAKEADSAKLVMYQGPFTVIVQNPNRSTENTLKDLNDLKDDPLGNSKAGKNDSLVRRGKKNYFSRITVEGIE